MENGVGWKRFNFYSLVCGSEWKIIFSLLSCNKRVIQKPWAWSKLAFHFKLHVLVYQGKVIFTSIFPPPHLSPAYFFAQQSTLLLGIHFWGLCVCMRESSLCLYHRYMYFIRVPWSYYWELSWSHEAVVLRGLCRCVVVLTYFFIAYLILGLTFLVSSFHLSMKSENLLPTRHKHF